MFRLMPSPVPSSVTGNLLADLESDSLQQALQLVRVPNALKLQDVLEQVGRDQLFQVNLPLGRRLHQDDFWVRPVDQSRLELRPRLAGRLPRP